MPKRTKFLMLEGLLTERGEFKMLAGYEAPTALPEDRWKGNSLQVDVVLTDSEGTVLGSSTPDVRFPAGCTPGPVHPGEGILIAAIADREGAERIVVRVAGREAFSQPLGRTPPSVKTLQVRPTSKYRLRVATTFGPQKPDCVRWFVDVEDGRVFPVPVDPARTKFTLDLRRYAGLGEARLRLEVSAGFRTRTIQSPTFPLPDARTTGRVLQPRDGAVCEFGDRLSLVGNLSDENGRPVTWDPKEVQWEIDGKAVPNTDPMVLCPELSPGTHRISLVRRAKGRRKERLDTVEISVEGPTAGSKAWAEALQRFREHRTREDACRDQLRATAIES